MTEKKETFNSVKINPKSQAAKIAFTYFFLSMLWIVSTDLYHFISAEGNFNNLLFSVIKGFVYTIITFTVFYILLKRYFTQLSKTVNRLEKSEETYRTLADNIDLGITRRDLNGRCLFMNNASRNISGRVPGFTKTTDFLGKTPDETYTDAIVSEAILNGVNRTIADSKPHTAELSYKEMHYEARFIPEFDDERKVESVIIIVSDRTDQKHQLSKLQESERFNRSLMSTFPGIVYIFDTESKQSIYSNRSLYELLGYKGDSFSNPQLHPFEEIIHPDDLSFYLTLGLMKIRNLKDGEYFENTFRVKDSEGNWRWFKCREIPYKYNSAGSVSMVLGTAIDINDIKEAEKEFIKNSNYLNAVVEASPLAIFDVNSEGRVMSLWNSAAERIFGYKAGEAIGRILPIVDDANKDEFTKNLEFNFSGNGFWGKELIRRGKSGKEIPIRIYTKPVKDAEGKVTHVLAFNEDLTEKKRIESELSRYSEYLKLLYEAGLYTIGTLDLQEIYRSLFDYISKIVDAGSVVVSSFDEKSGKIRCEASFISGKMVDVGFLPELDLQDVRSGFQSKAIHTGRSILVKDYFKELEGKDKMTFFDENGSMEFNEEIGMLPVAAIVIPLMHKNKPRGVLQVFTYEQRGYTDADVRRVEPLAVLIASAIERARLYDRLSRELEEKNRALEEIRKLSKGLEHSPNSIVITDSAGSIEYVNPYFTELTGYSVEEVYGKNPRILKSGNTQPEVHKELWQTITSGEVWHGELLNRKKSGELYWESASIGPVFDEQNNITHYIAVKQDITEKKKRDEQLNNSLLEKETMLKEIHHRVKNNLQVVSSLLNMQVEHNSHPEAIEAINTSRNRVKAMALVHENLYRSSNLMRTSMDSYIRMLVKNIYSAYGIPLERIRFTCDADEFEFGLDTIIPLGLIINETVSNSLKHAFPNGRSGEINITLSTSGDDGRKYLLVVKDNGIGLPGDFIPESSASLGMSLITSLASQLEGSAEITNKSGTRISVKFNELKYKSRV